MFGLPVSFGELTIILVVALVVLGPKHLPTLVQTLSTTLKNLRKASSELRSAIEQPLAEIQKPLNEIRNDLSDSVNHLQRHVVAMKDEALESTEPLRNEMKRDVVKPLLKIPEEVVAMGDALEPDLAGEKTDDDSSAKV